MKNRTSFKYKNIYIFISILSLIGFIVGYKYYDYQTNEIKKEIIENLNIKDELNHKINNVFKRIKNSGSIFISSILILPIIINIFKIFFEPFTIGFIFHTLSTYNLKFSFLYTIFYHVIPLILLLILIRISFTISKLIIGLIIYKKDKIILNKFKIIVKKYILITCFLVGYEILVIIYSSSLNNYLLSLISK